MNYHFTCDECGVVSIEVARPFHPPQKATCVCGASMRRVFGCQINTAGCQDADDIPPDQSIAYGGGANITAGQARNIERKHERQLHETRKVIADGGNRGSFKMTHQIPAQLFHGKIKQTGDKNYWDDPKNMNRHKSCKVD